MSSEQQPQQLHPQGPNLRVLQKDFQSERPRQAGPGSAAGPGASAAQSAENRCGPLVRLITRQRNLALQLACHDRGQSAAQPAGSGSYQPRSSRGCSTSACGLGG